MKKTLLIAFLGISVISCQPQPQRPTGLVPDTTMVQLLADMHILESAHNTKALEADSVPFSYPEIYAEIFRKHQVNKTQYDSTMFWLARDAEQLDAVYDRVIEELSKREAAVK